MSFLSVGAPALVGVVLAFFVSIGLVSSQTSAPEDNPADQAIITYGER